MGNYDKILLHWSFPQGYRGDRWHAHPNPHTGFHAIEVMAVCDAQMRFTNLVAKWHGSVHDSAIFNGSALQIHMQTKQQERWFLGDRDYGLQCHLMTP